MHAELWGISYGLQLAVANRYANIIVESDSLAALKLINNGCLDSHPCAPLVEDIKILSRCIPTVAWSYTPREGNIVADHLAKKGQNLPLGLHIFAAAPSDISHLLVFDCSGSLVLRGFS
ncbi:hypothetical protein Ahy_B04g072447 [Arachis hypogaea]|uniref:RNase H type-1 domain-containing protein n=1 Tax=Arachis hypogaea TaxID=3818 RepID=A0A444ZN46_ARAHY|nr:hypothetical protein Ahy_B04g072447 [Arachis hypogaea]